MSTLISRKSTSSPPSLTITSHKDQNPHSPKPTPSKSKSFNGSIPSKGDMSMHTSAPSLFMFLLLMANTCTAPDERYLRANNRGLCTKPDKVNQNFFANSLELLHSELAMNSDMPPTPTLSLMVGNSRGASKSNLIETANSDIERPTLKRPCDEQIRQNSFWTTDRNPGPSTRHPGEATKFFTNRASSAITKNDKTIDYLAAFPNAFTESPKASTKSRMKATTLEFPSHASSIIQLGRAQEKNLRSSFSHSHCRPSNEQMRFGQPSPSSVAVGIQPSQAFEGDFNTNQGALLTREFFFGTRRNALLVDPLKNPPNVQMEAWDVNPEGSPELSMNCGENLQEGSKHLLGENSRSVLENGNKISKDLANLSTMRRESLTDGASSSEFPRKRLKTSSKKKIEATKKTSESNHINSEHHPTNSHHPVIPRIDADLKLDIMASNSYFHPQKKVEKVENTIFGLGEPKIMSGPLVDGEDDIETLPLADAIDFHHASQKPSGDKRNILAAPNKLLVDKPELLSYKKEITIKNGGEYEQHIRNGPGISQVAHKWQHGKIVNHHDFWHQSREIFPPSAKSSKVSVEASAPEIIKNLSHEEDTPNLHYSPETVDTKDVANGNLSDPDLLIHGLYFDKKIFLNNPRFTKTQKEALKEIFKLEALKSKSQVFLKCDEYKEIISMFQVFDKISKRGRYFQLMNDNSKLLNGRRLGMEYIGEKLYENKKIWFKYWSEQLGRIVKISNENSIRVKNHKEKKMICFLIYVNMLEKIIPGSPLKSSFSKDQECQRMNQAYMRFSEYEKKLNSSKKAVHGVKMKSGSKHLYQTVWKYIQFWIQDTGTENLKRILFQDELTSSHARGFFDFIFNFSALFFQDILKNKYN